MSRNPPLPRIVRKSKHTPGRDGVQVQVGEWGYSSADSEKVCCGGAKLTELQHAHIVRPVRCLPPVENTGPKLEP